jgi:hypothetical protein
MTFLILTAVTVAVFAPTALMAVPIPPPIRTFA